MNGGRRPRVAFSVLMGMGAIAFLLGILQGGVTGAAPPPKPQAAPLDVVINEVAWAGTIANYNHEWIELKNNTSVTIALSGWQLVAADGTPSIALNGQIPPQGYFLLARTNYTNVVDVPADMIYTGALGDGGEALTLRDNLSNVIDTANGNGGAWPAGTGGTGTPPRATMERINPLAPDTDANWATNNPTIKRNGLDAGGNHINGTPKSRNSATAPDVWVAKSGPGLTQVGREMTYTLSFGNGGVWDAPDARITDTLPLSVTFVRQTSPYTFNQPVSGTLVWTVGAVPVGVQNTFELVVWVESNAAGYLTNSAVITSSEVETRTANNTAVWQTLVTQPLADLSIAKSGPLSATAGGAITYTLAFSNAGLADASGVVITDTLPAGVSFTRQTASYPFTRTGNVLVWAVGEVPATGAPVTFTVMGRIAEGAGRALVNRVEIAALLPEARLDNNAAVVTTSLVYLARPLDVVINEVAWAGHSGYTLDEWLELKNNTDRAIDLTGWQLAAADKTPSIVLNGVIPALGYFLLERTDDNTVSDIAADQIYGTDGTSWSLSNTGETLILTDSVGTRIDTANGNGGAWPAGSTTAYRTMERINPLAADKDVNWASNNPAIKRNGLDAGGNLINGTPKQSNSVSWADVRLTKQAPGSVLMGEQLTYTLIFSNGGPLDALGVVVSDTLPGAVVFVTQTSSYTFARDGQTLTWQIGALPAMGGASSLKVVVRANEGFTGLLVNTAAITSATPDYARANNVSIAHTLVTPPAADLSLAKFAPASVVAGNEITWTIILSNVGQLSATGVRVTDTLPLSVTFIRQSAPYTLTINGQILTWQVGDVPTSAAPLSWTVTGRVDVAFAGVMTNVVWARTTTTEAVLLNNADAVATLVQSPQPVVLLNAVLYDGYQNNDTDEAVEIINVGRAPVNLQNWRITKGTSAGVAFPAATLNVNRRVWAARNAESFFASFGFWPDFALVVTQSVLPLSGSWPVFANDGGDVQLRNAAGNLVDCLVYENGTPPSGCWSGAAVFPYSVSGVEGQIIARVPDERTGLPIADSDTAADWIQYTGNYTFGRRVLYPGWDMDMFFWPFITTAPATVTLGVAPDNAYDVVRDAIRSAQSRIEIEAYELTNHGIITAVVQQARAGVSVTVLLEGEPVGGISNQELWACQQIETAGGRCYFMHDYHPTGYHIFDRYDLIHSKFVIIDRRRLVVSTQNFSRGSLPNDDKSDGTYGSRGYVLYIESPELAARAAQIFERDLDRTHADIARWPNEQFGFGQPPAGYTPITTSGGFTSPVYFPQPLMFTDATSFELFTSPEAALRQSDALLGLLARAGAGDEVYVEQMYDYPHWGDYAAAPNLRLKAYIDAARRGAKVRILLNSGNFDDYVDLSKNISTTLYVNTLARQEGLDLQARMGNPTRYGIHSKIVLVKLNSQLPIPNTQYHSHVGSINGSEASSKINRELAVQVESAGLYAALARVFWTDWHLAAPLFLPAVLKNYTPPAPPVEYVVVSEVLYDPYGADTGKEWVELYNPTSRAIDISGWSLGDAVADGEYGSGRYLFPANTVLRAGQVIVIAQQAADVAPLRPDFEFLIDPNRDLVTVTNMIAVTPTWDGFGLALGNEGDEVILRDGAGNLVDAVVWGTGNYTDTGVLRPHPGVSVAAHSLERRPAMYDTNDCSRDFVDRYPPEPGKVSNTPGLLLRRAKGR